MTERAFFISDIHLGAKDRDALPGREQLFIQFLKQLEGTASHLFILGDLFEFWMEYRYFIPKAHFQVLSTLQGLSRSGIEVHYIAGNHDFALGIFFSHELGLHVHTGLLPLQLQGKRLSLCHGDGMASSDGSYRLLKKIITHPVSIRCFKFIHPDLGMAIARATGRSSRSLFTKDMMDEYLKAGTEMLKGDTDAVIHGHTHSAFIHETPHGPYINCGDWITKMSYIELQDGNFSLKYFPQDHAESLPEPAGPG